MKKFFLFLILTTVFSLSTGCDLPTMGASDNSTEDEETTDNPVFLEDAVLIIDNVLYDYNSNFISIDDNRNIITQLSGIDNNADLDSDGSDESVLQTDYAVFSGGEYRVYTIFSCLDTSNEEIETLAEALSVYYGFEPGTIENNTAYLTKTGTYAVSGNQVTLTLDTKVETFTFSSNLNTMMDLNHTGVIDTCDMDGDLNTTEIYDYSLSYTKSLTHSPSDFSGAAALTLTEPDSDTVYELENRVWELSTFTLIYPDNTTTFDLSTFNWIEGENYDNDAEEEKLYRHEYFMWKNHVCHDCYYFELIEDGSITGEVETFLENNDYLINTMYKEYTIPGIYINTETHTYNPQGYGYWAYEVSGNTLTLTSPAGLPDSEDEDDDGDTTEILQKIITLTPSASVTEAELLNAPCYTDTPD